MTELSQFTFQEQDKDSVAYWWALAFIYGKIDELKEVMCDSGNSTLEVMNAHYRRCALMEIITHDTLTRNGVWKEVMDSPVMKPEVADALMMDTDDPEDVKEFMGV